MTGCTAILRRHLAGLSVLLALSFAAPSPIQAEAGTRPRIGVHTTTADLNRLKAWQAWTGEPASIVGENLFAITWEDFTGRNPEAGIGFTLDRWERAFRDPESGIEQETVTLDLALPMFPLRPQLGAPDYVKIEDRWRQGADGRFNTHFEALARTLVEKGFGRSHLRLGWEFNLPAGLNAWAIRDQPQHWPLFKAYWREIHSAMMSVEGAEFQWVWSVLLGDDEEGFVPERDAWPGDAFVDIIGADLYDTSGNYYWQQYEMEKPEVDWATLRRWNWDTLAHGIRRDPYSGERLEPNAPCLDSYRAFARERGKRFALTEWGIVGGDRFPSSDHWGGNDNPGFIETLHHWIQTNEVDYALYFEHFMAHHEYGDVDHTLLPNYWNQEGVSPDFVHPDRQAHPASAATYLALFHPNAPARYREVPDPSKQSPVYSETFEHFPPPHWELGDAWGWRRDCLHLDGRLDRPTTASTSYHPSDHDLIEARLSLPSSEQPVELLVGPYSITVASDPRGTIDSVTLRRVDSGKVLTRAWPERPYKIDQMLLPFRIELARLAAKPDMVTVRISVGSEGLITHLDSGVPSDDSATLGIAAPTGAEAFLGKISVTRWGDAAMESSD